jgi:hypothetical protein
LSTAGHHIDIREFQTLLKIHGWDTHFAQLGRREIYGSDPGLFQQRGVFDVIQRTCGIKDQRDFVFDVEDALHAARRDWNTELLSHLETMRGTTAPRKHATLQNRRSQDFDQKIASDISGAENRYREFFYRIGIWNHEILRAIFIGHLAYRPALFKEREGMPRSLMGGGKSCAGRQVDEKTDRRLRCSK